MHIMKLFLVDKLLPQKCHLIQCANVRLQARCVKAPSQFYLAMGEFAEDEGSELALQKIALFFDNVWDWIFPMWKTSKL